MLAQLLTFPVLTDSYKVTHWPQYEPGTEEVYSYGESRGGPFPYTIPFGNQYVIKEYLEGKRITRDNIAQAKLFWASHFGSDKLFNEDGFNYILKKHGGRLPIEIKAVPEGTPIPTHNVLMTVRNTDKRCFWLTNWIETILLQTTWYGSTVAALSRECKSVILKFLQETGDTSLINFKLHDFGFRGASSVETAAVGGAAHLVNFMGTDTSPGIVLAMHYYKSAMPGFSIPASEHSTITSWGQKREFDAYRNMLEKYPTGLVACVSDSYDIEAACRDGWGGELKEAVLARDGTLVVRPDSGYPPDVVVRVLNILGEKFGFTVNQKGYRVLHPKVRVIQGDGINLAMIYEILSAMKANSWSADNIAFGMGGALLQQVNRDTQKYAFKCSSVVVNGEQRNVFKKPATDWSKESKPGRHKLTRVFTADGGITYRTMPDTEANKDLEDVLVPIFRDGDLLNETTFDEIRKRASL